MHVPARVRGSRLVPGAWPEERHPNRVPVPGPCRGLGDLPDLKSGCSPSARDFLRLSPLEGGQEAPCSDLFLVRPDHEQLEMLSA